MDDPRQSSPARRVVKAFRLMAIQPSVVSNSGLFFKTRLLPVDWDLLPYTNRGRAFWGGWCSASVRGFLRWKTEHVTIFPVSVHISKPKRPVMYSS